MNNSASSSPDGQQKSGLLSNGSDEVSSSASSSSDVPQEQASHDGNRSLSLEKHPSASSSEKSIASITVALK